MSRPLLISDCDEVLLHMMRHFSAWLDSEHGVEFVPQPENFGRSMRYRETGDLLAREQMWAFLSDFFRTEMHRQTLVPDVLESLGRIGEVADIVILTNVGDEFHASRVAQLDAVGIRHHVVCNLGPKGPAVARLIDERAPERSVFVDDIAAHHGSVAEHKPDTWRLHMVADPDIARLIPPAPAAHKRIDDWASATGWVLDRLTQA